MKLRIFLIIIFIILITYLINLLPTYQTVKTAAAESSPVQTSLSDNDIVKDIMGHINVQQQEVMIKLDSLASIEKSSERKSGLWHQLALYSYDSLSQMLLYYLYEYKSVDLSLNQKYREQFAQLLMQQVFSISQPIYQQWFANKAKSLWLTCDSTSDSVKISILACDLLGSLTSQPMVTVGLIQKYTGFDATKTYSNFVLGLAGKKSGQFSKAIQRFLVILHTEPKNMDILLNLAECYELNNQIDSAKLYYQNAYENTSNDFLKKSLKDKLTSLVNNH